MIDCAKLYSISISNSNWSLPTDMVVTTLSVDSSITDIVFELLLVTYDLWGGVINCY